MDSIDNMNVFEYGRPPPGAAVVGSMFVYEEAQSRRHADKYKARLVAHGHRQLYGETFTETFAPGTQI
eukprot:667928-Prorocentrum_minimum.AAC.1